MNWVNPPPGDAIPGSGPLGYSVQSWLWHRPCKTNLKTFWQAEKIMLTFIIGLFIGALVGIATMSLLVISKDKDRLKAESTP